MAACFVCLLQRILSSEARIASADLEASDATVVTSPGPAFDTSGDSDLASRKRQQNGCIGERRYRENEICELNLGSN